MTKNLKLFTIFCLLLLFCLGYTKTVKASSFPTMSTEQAQAIIDFYKTKDFDTEIWDNQSTNTPVSGDNAYFQNILNNTSASQFAQQFNNQASNLDINWNWDNVSIFVRKGRFNATYSNINVTFVISSKGLSNTGLDPYKINTHTSTYVYNTIQKQTSTNSSQKIIQLILNYANYNVTSNTIDSFVIHPKRTPQLSQDELYITNFSDILSINTTSKFYWNNVLYSISGDYVEFDSNGNVIENEPIEGDTESSLGYYFYESPSVNVKQINKLSLDNYQNLDEWWYVGNDLNFDYDYYYLNNNEKVSVKQYVDIVQTSNSGDTGKFYIPRIDRQKLDNLPNETGFYLDLTVNSGDIILANQFYSFVTYSSVVDSGATGTITNTSGDVTGNIDLTGIQSALTNEASFENVNISSGDISSSLGFNFETDPYANFWLTFTQGLNTALNTSVRTIQIPFRDKTYTINLDNYTTQEPSALKVFFATISSTFVCLGLLKWIKKTIDEITSGDVDNLLKNNQEERYHKFILGGV